MNTNDHQRIECTWSACSAFNGDNEGGFGLLLLQERQGHLLKGLPKPGHRNGYYAAKAMAKRRCLRIVQLELAGLVPIER